MRSVSWPTQGDKTTFRRRSLVLGGVLAVVVLAPLVAAAAIDTALVAPALPLALGASALCALWVHGAARTAARRAELERSFAGLVVLHHGATYRVAARSPILGAYPNRRQAATAALERGGWAIVVQAWDRCWLLDAAPVAARDTSDAKQPATPVSFRSRAVADVIPAIA